MITNNNTHNNSNNKTRMDDRLYFQCSTPIKTSASQSFRNSTAMSSSSAAAAATKTKSRARMSPTRLGSDDEIRELQTSLSELALENEELKLELKRLARKCHELSNENQQLHQTVQDQREIQSKMRKQLATVTRTVYVIYERFKSLKSRYYEEQFNGIGFGDGGGDDGAG